MNYFFVMLCLLQKCARSIEKSASQPRVYLPDHILTYLVKQPWRLAKTGGNLPVKAVEILSSCKFQGKQPRRQLECSSNLL